MSSTETHAAPVARKTKATKVKAGSRKHILRNSIIAFIIIVVAGLIAARIYLPHWVTDYVNRQIAALDGYSGSVRDIDIHLWRGAYQIHDLDIHKAKGGLKEPFVAAKSIDLSIEWNALWHGTVVAEIDISDIALTFSKSQSGQGANWTSFLDNLTPFDINRLSVNGGKVSYVDAAAQPKVNLYIDGISAEVTNLRNVEEKEVALPSDLRVEGQSIGKGKLAITGRGNILKDVPDFDLDMKLENAELTAFNSYTIEAAAIDFTSGTISVYSELGAANGRVTGYVKPIATDVKMVSAKQDSNPINFLWESIAATFMAVFKNHPSDQFALRIPIEGSLDSPKSDGWTGFWSIFQNTFGKAFPRNTDGSIDFSHALKKYRDEK